jgi:hypothetical protein
MNDQLQQLGDFGLELLLGHTIHYGSDVSMVAASEVTAGALISVVPFVASHANNGALDRGVHIILGACTRITRFWSVLSN